MNKIVNKMPDTDTVVKALAAHPFLWAFALCMCVHTVFFSDISIYLTTYSLFAQQIIVQLIAAAVLLKLRDSGRLNFIGFIVLELVCGGGVFALFMLYSGSRKKLLFVQLFLAMMVCAAFVYLRKKIAESRYKEQLYSLFIMLMGFTVKVSYSLVTTSTDRQHDLFDLGDYEYGGHLGYIKYLMDLHHLPNEKDPRTVWQYYHPPLHHIISALWAGFHKYVLGFGQEHALFTVKTLSLFYSLCMMILCYKLFRYFRLHGAALFIPLCIVSFSPQFVYFAGSMNNDALAAAFSLGALVTALEWYRERTVRNILKAALCIGLGMMSKMSAALIAPAVAVLFLIAFIKYFKAEWKQLIGQFACFGAVCVPLGLWYGVRNYLIWGVPLTYVQELPEGFSSGNTYIGDIDPVSRIFYFSPEQFKYSNIFLMMGRTVDDTGAESFFDRNPLVALMKSSLFNEYFNSLTFGSDRIFDLLAYVLFWLNAAIAAFALFCMIRSLIKKSDIPLAERAFPAFYHVILVYSFYSLCLRYPYTFSMNFRYVSPLVPVGALYIGLYLAGADGKKEAASDHAGRGTLVLRRVLTGMAAAYAVSCTVMIISGCCPHSR